jgi:hypothetical protein
VLKSNKYMTSVATAKVVKAEARSPDTNDLARS